MFLFKKNKSIIAFMSGKLIPIDQVKDDVFSKKMMGDGVAVQPVADEIYAPCDGVVTVVFEGTEHAIGITMENGVELLIHCGLDTVNLSDKACDAKIKKGEKVKAGQLLMVVDRKKLKALGYDDITMLVVLNAGKSKEINFIQTQEVIAGKTEIGHIK